MIRECFSQVKKDREVTGRALSEVTGIPDGSISNFLNGKKDLTVTTFWTLLEGMEKLSPGALESFCSLLAGRASEIKLNEEQIADQIIALGTAWKRLHESKTNL